MGQGFLMGQRGGFKVYTEADCTIDDTGVTSTVNLPSGVTWGDIKHLLLTAYSTLVPTKYEYYLYKATPKSSAYNSFDGQQGSGTVSMSDTDTSIPIKRGTDQNIIYHVYKALILV
jgi:hypothetical protein